ncbi:MFS transporter [Paenibacillus cymbidii]|uniref:MFS transporter n=1 Tax=Paenibacillus cymbidii TaxID=1639034 RepID=UPI0010820B81|nr:MFS transporter [Paenibacillus cymbidii]
MKLTNRIYADAALQNIKNVAFFTFLQVLIARLGASNFEIALSNVLPQLFGALSLAFLARQFPISRLVYLTGGYVRQFAFLSMALCVMLPHAIPWVLTFWGLNAAAVMVTEAQKPAILRKWVEPGEFPRIFSTNKLIGIVIMVAGSYTIGHALDMSDRFFPYNYVVSMLVGCLSTFAGMALIAGLAPNDKQPIRFRKVTPLRESDRTMWWIGLNTAGINMVAPLFIIYHVKMLHLTNAQIGLFAVVSGALSALALPLARRGIEKLGPGKIYGAAILGAAVVVLPYGWIGKFGLLVALQAWIGVCIAVQEVASQSIMMEEAGKHRKELDYFSDYQLVMCLGNAAGALAAGGLLAIMPLWACFCVIAALRLFFLATIRLTLPLPASFFRRSRRTGHDSA